MRWRPTDQCTPLAEMPSDVETLWAIRLMPPGSNDYFIEFLNVPAEEQAAPKLWIPVQLNGGWYGLPRFKFIGVLNLVRPASDEGLGYPAPGMMGLSNLLLHPAGHEIEIESAGFRGLCPRAQELGR